MESHALLCMPEAQMVTGSPSIAADAGKLAEKGKGNADDSTAPRRGSRAGGGGGADGKKKSSDVDGATAVTVRRACCQAALWAGLVEKLAVSASIDICKRRARRMPHREPVERSRGRALRSSLPSSPHTRREQKEQKLI